MFRSFRGKGPWSIVSLAALAIAAGFAQTAWAASPKVPDGFTIRLVAAVPAVQYPCQVATAPGGRLFVAEDPMDQVGPADKAIDRILLFQGGAEPTVFADKLFAIFGMVWHKESLYVMNMPHLTVLRDTDGDGKADQRTELFKDLGVPAGSPNDFNDHIVSGLKIGIDGYLYISVGDKGVPKATGKDGRTAQVAGGGTLRCRLDGTGLEVFSTGTRNHLEPNLDDRDNLFTYDNTDDGLGWWTRVTHHIDGGYFGYPFDYHKRTDRMLPRMAEYGGGSPCGGVYYGEDAWPETYRGRLFWAEWGKRSVQAFRVEKSGATFKVADVIDFVEPGEVESFRPLDLALSEDGKTLYIADWSMGGWGNKTEKLGRVYAVTYTGNAQTKGRPRVKDSDPLEAQLSALDHPSFHERFRAQTALIARGKPALTAAVAALAAKSTSAIARRHLVWVIDGIAGGTPEASFPLIDALSARDADVRAQAARALGERAAAIARPALVERLADADPSVRLQAIIALGRIGDSQAIPAIVPAVADADFYLAYAARQALRRINDWEAAAKGLDAADPKVRAGVLLAMDQVYDVKASSALARFAAAADRPVAERVKAVAFLAEVERKAPPWDGRWWGTQPARQKPPARTVRWDGSTDVAASIRALLADPVTAIRVAAIEALVETNHGESPGLLRARFSVEKDLEVERAIVGALGRLGDKDSLDLLTKTLRDQGAPLPLREAALEAVEQIGSKKAVDALTELLAKKTLKPERQPRVIAALGRFRDRAAVGPLTEALRSESSEVRAAAIDALVAIMADQDEIARRGVSTSIRPLLTDRAPSVRHRAIAAAGALSDRQAVSALMTAAENPEDRFEASLALAALPEIHALQVYLRGLTDKNAELRKSSAAAISQIRQAAAPVLEQLAARHELPPAAVPELTTIFAARAPVTDWQILGPFASGVAPALDLSKGIDKSASFEGEGGRRITWQSAKPSDDRGEVNLGHIYSERDLDAFGYAEIEAAADRTAQMAVGSDDTLTVWLNGKEVYDHSSRRGFTPEEDRFDVTLRKGTNRLFVKCGNRGGLWQFAVAVATPADYAFLKKTAAGFDPEAYRAFALKSQGNPHRGRQLFADLKGLACVKCHAVGREGGSVGPELSSVGAKYPRDELIASVLYPSAKISSGYEPTTLALADGRVVTGIVRGENSESIEIQDADAKLIKYKKDEIEERKRSDVSLMPNGLAQGLSTQDFADLIAYLETLKTAKN